MRIRHAVFAGVTAAALALLPATAFAAQGVDEGPEKPKGTKFSVAQKTVEAGGTFTAQGRCVISKKFVIVAPEGFKQISDKSVVRGGGIDVKLTFRVQPGVKPGEHWVTMLCDTVEPSALVKVVPATKKEPVKKQVSKVPAGAPQTGGGPVDEPASAGWLIAGLAGAGVAGAGGVVLMRRRPASRS
ncbi:hypothetical protein ACIQUM_32295 [Amycolatopsis azurea]|uniref:hypothetical protein n=1 Tax=Amycolatopsis azurea TaxID=36819 RepID=UPI003813A638